MTLDVDPEVVGSNAMLWRQNTVIWARESPLTCFVYGKLINRWMATLMFTPCWFLCWWRSYLQHIFNVLFLALISVYHLFWVRLCQLISVFISPNLFEVGPNGVNMSVVLSQLCLQRIVNEFERYYLFYSSSDDPNILLLFEFLRKFFNCSNTILWHGVILI